MRRHRLEEKEIPEVKRGLLLRIRELLIEEKDLEAATTAYKLYSRLDSKRAGRPGRTNVDWELLSYIIDSLLQ